MARTAREVLNELRWRVPGRLADAILWYHDRTRSEGYRLIRGSEIVGLERRYFTTGSGRLPYYKIVRIEVNGEILFER
ncbi:MAG: RNA repair domain-containing protein [Thermoplasmata archaeon]